MANSGSDNLIRAEDLTSEELRERARNGGIASGEARREKGRIRRALEIALEKVYNVEGKQVTGTEGIVARMVVEALNGNVQAFKEIRDTVGEKPKDEVNVGGGLNFNSGGLNQTLEALKRED